MCANAAPPDIYCAKPKQCGVYSGTLVTSTLSTRGASHVLHRNIRDTNSCELHRINWGSSRGPPATKKKNIPKHVKGATSATAGYERNTIHSKLSSLKRMSYARTSTLHLGVGDVPQTLQYLLHIAQPWCLRKHVRVLGTGGTGRPKRYVSIAHCGTLLEPS